MRKYGFNIQWMFLHENQKGIPLPPDEKALDFMADHGFNIIRFPLNYRFWAPDKQYYHVKEDILEYVDAYISACRERKIHASIGLHHAPGYCISSHSQKAEVHNLWTDEPAQKAFTYYWEMFAKRYKEICSEELSFNLLNEPPDIGTRGMTRENHNTLMKIVMDAIWAIDPKRLVMVDGLNVGFDPIPEFADLPIVQGARGYQPFPVSHYGAEWEPSFLAMPKPEYPGMEWRGCKWDIDAHREHYQEWREAERSGVDVIIGEFGCYRHTPNDMAMRWFRDLFQVYKESGWGWLLWGFEGAFGIIEHNRPGAVFEEYKGYKVDRALLDLMLENMHE